MDARIYPVVWLLGLMLAPHTLSLLGNLAGQLQWLLPVALAAGIGLFCLNAVSLRHLTERSPHSAYPLEALSRELGHLPADMIFFSGRYITALALSTVLLVTSGFVFNETFVYWFPNFAFAFFLLGLVMTIHLMGAVAARRFQLVCIALALAGILVLTAMGLLATGPTASAQAAWVGPIGFGSLLAVVLLFVGFDLATDNEATTGNGIGRPMVTGLLVAGLTLSLWAIVSIRYVPADRLADSFIAHTLVAKAIGGQAGRLIMGGVIIAGTCAAVNALLWNQGRNLARWLNDWKADPRTDGGGLHGAAGSLLSGVVIAAMMATGMAGEDEIDIYVRTGLYFWLMFYAAVHLAILIRRQRDPAAVSPAALRTAVLGGPLMTAIATGLVLTDPHWVLVLRTGAVVLTFIMLISVTGRILNRRIVMKGNQH